MSCPHLSKKKRNIINRAFNYLTLVLKIFSKVWIFSRCVSFLGVVLSRDSHFRICRALDLQVPVSREKMFAYS